MSFSLHHIKGIYCQHDSPGLTLSSVTWLKQCWSAFSPVIYSISPALHTVFLRGKLLHSDTLEQWGIVSHSGRGKYFHKLFGILLPEKSASSSIVIQSFIRISNELVDIYFILCTIPRYYFISFVQIVLALAIGKSFSGFPCPFNTSHHFVYVCLFIYLQGGPYFLALPEVAGSSCIFPAPVVDFVLSPRSPGSLH